MPETRSRLADDLARLFNDAAGVAGGVRREVDTLVRRWFGSSITWYPMRLATSGMRVICSSRYLHDAEERRHAGPRIIAENDCEHISNHAYQ